MRVRATVFAAMLFGGVFVPALFADERYLTVVFGPASLESAKQGAHAVAGTLHRWLHTPGAAAEVRRAGMQDVQMYDSKTIPKDLESALTEAAMQSRDSNPAAFVTALDAAVQSTALHPGVRVVVAVLNSPPWSSDAEAAFRRLVEVCRDKAVRSIVLDIQDSDKSDPNAPLDAFAKRTGGSWLHQGKALESSVLMIAPVPGPELHRASGPEPAPAPGPTGGGIEYAIPVGTRFIRTSSTGSASVGSTAHMSDNDAQGSNMMMAERAFEANDSHGPMNGLMLVESPLNALKFEVDDNAGTYLAKARITAAVRNSKGVAVWSGQKEITVRGPMRKMDERRQGSLVFLRGITVLGGDRYMLEATVEDLLAGSRGSMHTPLTTGAGAPGLMASDALFVRPYKGGADRFEADQVFAYDGEALSPVLNPVFRAEDPIRLQLYLVLYPDINGPQPDLNLELRRDGRVVARMAIPFKSQLRNVSTEGKFGSMSGTGSILGGKAKEFPYIADMKGAKLGPGNYEAIVSIRQGGNVITRNASFVVTGTAAPGVMEIGDAPRTSLKSQVDPDNADIVLPEIAPATIDSSGLAMSAEEQKRMWDEAAKGAMGYSSHLPNFRCTQETHRFTAPARNPDQLKEIDSYKDELTYEGGRESYRTVEVNGVKTDAARADLKGVRSSGEFGSMLAALFDPERGATHKWAGRAMSMGVLCQVFDVAVPKAKSNFTLTHNGSKEAVAYNGRVFIEEETGLVRRITIQGAGLPKEFALQSPSFSLEYAMVKIGPTDYLLPLRSILQVKQLKTFVRNETTFRGYRKFEAQIEIKFVNK